MLRLGKSILALTLFLAACTAPGPDASVFRPKARPDLGADASPESRRIRAYYASQQSRLISQGKLRTDYAPLDAPFGVDDLMRNFERVALFDEYSVIGGRFVERQTASFLRRWNKPVRIGLHFGPSITPEQRAADQAEVEQFAARLSEISGLSMRVVDPKNANFLMLFLTKDEQSTQINALAQTYPHLIIPVAPEISSSPRNIYCAAYNLSDHSNQTLYSGAVILIKDEIADLMRQSCIQEEMTQALGLANDSPDIRPSMFNDDEEFALLTEHDEVLLRMLYDPRMRAGMTPELARPVLRQVAETAINRSQ